MPVTKVEFPLQVESRYSHLNNFVIDIAKERGITEENKASIHPAKIARVIFSKLIPELSMRNH